MTEVEALAEPSDVVTAFFEREGNVDVYIDPEIR